MPTIMKFEGETEGKDSVPKAVSMGLMSKKRGNAETNQERATSYMCVTTVT